MKLIYVVEDHQVIREGVRRYLEMAGYKVLSFGNLTSVRAAFKITKADLLIQDVMLPDGDGFEFVKELRQSYDIPVIFMTARITEEDRIHGFELGADDYITKPFSPKELVLRVQAIFRRVDGGQEVDKGHRQTYKAGSSVLCYDEIEHKVTVNNEPITLTAAEWRILGLLIENSSRILPRSEILKKCFDYTSESYERIADTHIKNLRAKLGSDPWIETVRGYGYRFIGYPIEENI
ncbi:MAG TPA: DNA-binding response regulator [Sphaerochaeta sp.]|jgi:DNA-binding response OmpR family regulator|nr:DNA-binding response regulator [Sphaerochaeta sp.]